MPDQTRRATAELLSVGRWGEDDLTPVVIDGKGPCGTWSDHYDKGCIRLEVKLMGASRLVHLTTEEALRLSDLLRAIADTNTATDQQLDGAGGDHG